MKQEGRILTILGRIFLLLLVVPPVYFMVIVALKPRSAIYREPSLLPQPITTDNFVGVIERGFMLNVANSFIVALGTAVLALILGVLAAYSLARLRFPGRQFASRAVLLSYLTPLVLLFIPLSVTIAQLGLGNTLAGLIIVYLTFAVPLVTWLLTSEFRDFPTELEEAAALDGASRLRTLFSVLIPVTAPAIATAGSLAFVMAWGELFLALTFVKGDDVMTAPAALQHLSTGDVQQYGLVMAGAILSAIPVVVIYYLSQRWVTAGNAAGALKG